MLAQSFSAVWAKRIGLSTVAVLPALVLSACDKVPLLAPGGTVISLFATANTVPVNGEIEIVATAIENGTTTVPTTPANPTTPSNPANPANPATPTPTPTTPTGTSSSGAGTPVQNGTVITFTTTLGRIEPTDARTQNGQVRVRFISNGQSGTATITAFSGGASAKLENLRVGTAAVERLLLSANPQALPPNGGNAEISARVEDVSGAPISGAPVVFTTDVGQVSPSTATTDSSGVAKSTLTATAKATVTASVAGKTATVAVSVNARTGVTITGPTTSVAAGTPTTFTVGVAATANIRDVSIDYGDGSRQSLGALSASTPVQHTYSEEGTYRVSATAIDATGFTETVATSVTILPQQPPSVIIQASPTNPVPGQTVIFTASVSGATSTILRYEWTFEGGTPATATTTGNRQTATFTGSGTKVITVRVIQASGPSGDGTTVITLQSTTPVTAIKK
jgi:hypothetical protein